MKSDTIQIALELLFGKIRVTLDIIVIILVTKPVKQG
jgi:hypothetical protein